MAQTYLVKQTKSVDQYMREGLTLFAKVRHYADADCRKHFGPFGDRDRVFVQGPFRANAPQYDNPYQVEVEDKGLGQLECRVWYRKLREDETNISGGEELQPEMVPK